MGTDGAALGTLKHDEGDLVTVICGQMGERVALLRDRNFFGGKDQKARSASGPVVLSWGIFFDKPH